MIYVVRINDKEYEVEVEKGQAQITKTAVVQPVAAPAPVVAAAPAAAPAPAAPVPAVPSGVGDVIKSPMPGTILDIKAPGGTRVKKGDTVLILEAMKMENEIAAPHDGVITQIYVAKGASVATSDALFSIQ